MLSFVLDYPEGRTEREIKLRFTITIGNKIVFYSLDSSTEAVDKPQNPQSFCNHDVSVVVYMWKIFRVSLSIEVAVILDLDPVIVFVELNWAIGIICSMAYGVHE